MMSTDLDTLLDTIAELEAEPPPVETDDERRARALAEFDALMADDPDVDDHPWYDSWSWTADPNPDPVHLPPLPPLIRPLPTRRGRRIGVSIPADDGDWADTALAAMTDPCGFTVPAAEFAQLVHEAGWG